MSAWSSTVSTRIGLGLLTILGLLPIIFPSLPSPEPESALRVGFAIRNGRGNRQLDFGSGSVLAPNFQVPAKALGAFAHPREAPVSRTSPLIGNFWIDSHSVVAHVQEKLGISIRDFHFDLLRFRMAKSVS